METISRISSMLESARELTLEAAQSASTAKGPRTDYNSRGFDPPHIKKLLDSRSERDILEGMRRVISLMYRSESCLHFFSAVVKNVANPNIEVKKLVYIYLLHHAETEPDLALLSINTIQKSLTDQNPQVRAMALRTMSGIKVPVISQIVSLAIKRGCADMSPHVRKAAALAIPKCYRLDPNTLPQLEDYLSILLADTQYFVVGPAVSAFLDICPNRLDLIHKHYRSLVKKLLDMDEWSQLATLRLLTAYSRKCFPRRRQKGKMAQSNAFYDMGDGAEVRGKEPDEDADEEDFLLDPDLESFLQACKPLLQSRNSAVVMSVVRIFLFLGTSECLKTAIGPLVALVRCPQDIQYVALHNIVAVALKTPDPFAKYVSHFLIQSTEPSHIWRLKLEVLTILFPHLGLHWKSAILCELKHFSRGTDPDLIRESVQAIGRCAQSDPQTSSLCLHMLLEHISSVDEGLVSESLTVIRHLIQQDPSSHKATVVRLARNLDTTTSPEARATIIWLVGEFAGVDAEDNIAPDVLRILAKGFADETEVVKQQIVLLGAKVYLHHLLLNPPPEHQHQEPQTEQVIHNEWAEPSENKEEQRQPEQPDSQPEESRITTLWRYILLLTRYDTSYDLRDRARFYKALLANPAETQLASLLLLAPKPVPYTPSPSDDRKDLLVGTSTLVIGPEAGTHGLRGYEPLPDMVLIGEEPDPSLRDYETPILEGMALSSMTAGERLDKVLQQHESSAPARTKQNGTSRQAANTTALNEWLDAGEEEGDESDEDDEDDEDDEETGSGEEEETDSEDGQTESGEEETNLEEEEETESEGEFELSGARETKRLLAGNVR
jgi:vesicle coat complex subunit